MSQRVVVTGIGIITPIGIGPEEFWDSVISGKSGLSEIKSFDAAAFKTRSGCEVKNFDPDGFAGEIGAGAGRSTQFALAASKMALSDSNFDARNFNPERVGVILGSSVSDFPETRCNSIANAVSHAFNLSGPIAVTLAACAAGNYAICQAFDAVQSGRADCMLAGGVESFSKRAFIGFSRLRLIAPDACRPFDRNRKGIVLGEGGGVLLLESLDSARNRGARIYAEILGYGLSCDAFHIVSPHPDGEGAALAMTRALESARVQPDQVDYISAHGNGTPGNDKAETAAIKKVFASYAYRLAISSVKALTGHCLAAAGAIGAIASVLAIERGVAPPTWNYETPDPDCDLDYVPNEPREKKIDVVLNNSYAFGGNNASVVLSRLTGARAC
ncbi:MAG TPA: beta-ketoacyl-[acyl-carrier-protein] synthase family protein [Blastocatellia bacterium]|nr:beta-ketoacyl-[acyl-carrier-protein] synthase family protein [Blastocatellia bacterium]